MRFIHKKPKIEEALKPLENAKNKKMSLKEIKEISDKVVGQIEQQPEILEEVMRQLYERGIEIPEDIIIEISKQVIQKVSESDKMPKGSTVRATQAIAKELPDDAIAEIASNVDLGISGKTKIVEIGITNEERQREEKVNIVYQKLKELYENVEDVSRDENLVSKVKDILKNLPQTTEEEKYKINQTINTILAKKIMQNYLRYNSTMITTFSGLQSPEEMLANNIPLLAKCEYRKIPTEERAKYQREYKEQNFRQALLSEIAQNVVTEFAEDGFKKVKIPQSEQMKHLSSEDEEYFVKEIKERVKKLNSDINPFTEMDIREQIRGNITAVKQVEDYVTAMGNLPEDTKEKFMQQGQEIMQSEELLEISHYCNTVGLYQALSELGVDRAKKIIDTLMDSLEKRQQKRVVSKDETPKIKKATFSKKNEEEQEEL